MRQSPKRYNAISEYISRNEYQNAGRSVLEYQIVLKSFRTNRVGCVVSLSGFLLHKISFVRNIGSLCEHTIAFTGLESIKTRMVIEDRIVYSFYSIIRYDVPLKYINEEIYYNYITTYGFISDLLYCAGSMVLYNNFKIEILKINGANKKE